MNIIFFEYSPSRQQQWNGLATNLPQFPSLNYNLNTSVNTLVDDDVYKLTRFTFPYEVY